MKFAKLDKRAITPKQANIGDAGYDLHALLDEPFELAPKETRIISTGLVFEIPYNCAGLILPRSGLAIKHGITVPNSPGLIDSGYRGEIKVGLHNEGESRFVINHGDRIAQFVMIRYEHCFFEHDTSEVGIEELTSTERDTGGFGSSGIKKGG